MENDKQEKNVGIESNKEWDEMCHSMKQSLEWLKSKANNLEDAITVDEIYKVEIIMKKLGQSMENEQTIEKNESLNEFESNNKNAEEEMEPNVEHSKEMEQNSKELQQNIQNPKEMEQNVEHSKEMEQNPK